MAEYIKRKAALALVQPDAPEDEKAAVTIATAKKLVRNIVRRTPAADVAPVRHGRWIEHEETQEDAYSHHKCSECNVNAPFYYKMREDWDEGMDGEWYSIGLVDDGINEYLTGYCPNCGARMDGDDDAKPEE